MPKKSISQEVTMAMAPEEDTNEEIPTIEMENKAEDEVSHEELNESMDLAFVQESSMNESQGTEDLQVTLQEAMALRKNLETKFENEVENIEPTPSIRETIAHFEKKASQNRVQAVDNAKRPPLATIETSTTARDMAPSRLKVFLRVRPCANKEASTIEILGNSDGKSLPTTIRTYPPEASVAAKTDRPRLTVKSNDANGDAHSIKEYDFTTVLEPSTSQASVFEKTAAPLVNGLCQGNSAGKSALLFCYGITNAGKTHTVLGDPRKQESWGIIPRCLATLMQRVEHTDMDVYLSSFEIYNEQLLDLLPSTSDSHNRLTSNGASLKIREGPHGQMVIPGLAEYKVESMKMGLSLIRRAKEGRHTAPNHLNSQSSRSHSICQLTVRKRVQPPDNDSKEAEPARDAHLWIVDLAGNERSKRTNAGSLRQKEAAYINMSLMTLMRCVTRTHKPYRDSKLTMLFMHHWNNAENTTTMIVNVNGAASDYDETQHVLSYAISSKSIPTVASKPQSLAQTKCPEYDLDGRRKGGKQLTMVQKAAKMMRKLSPKRVMPARKRKNPPPPVRGPFASTMEGLDPVVKKTRRDQEASIGKGVRQAENKSQELAPTSRDLSSLQMQLAVAKAENQTLERKNRELTQQLESTETSIRSEISEEMLNEMMDMRRRYEATINKLKESFMECEEPQGADHLEKAHSKIDELVEKVEECEEEMSRMSRVHRSELAELKEDHRAALLKKGEEIEQLKTQLSEKANKASEDPFSQDLYEVAELKKQLTASRAEVEQVKRSKEEIVKNYEQLLAPEEDDDEEEEDEMEEKDDVVKKASPTAMTRPKSTEAFLNPRHLDPVDEARMEAENQKEDMAPTSAANPEDGENQPNNVNAHSPTSAENRTTPRSFFSPKDKSRHENPAEPKASEAAGKVASSKKQPLGRKPFSIVNKNLHESDDDSDSFGPEKWLAPKRPAIKDPKTGLYSRPPGRAPSSADGWDPQKGAWRMSMAM